MPLVKNVASFKAVISKTKDNSKYPMFLLKRILVCINNRINKPNIPT